MASRFIIRNFKGLKKEDCNERLKKKVDCNAKLRAKEAKELTRLRELKNRRVKAVKARAISYAQEYLDREKELVEIRRKAKADGSFYKEADAKVAFVIRIKGINKLTPKPKLVLKLFRLLQLHNGVFVKLNKATSEMLRIVNPYVTYGYPSLGTIRKLLYKRGYAKLGKPGARQRVRISNEDLISEHLGKYGIESMEDLVHEIYTCGPHFKEATNFLWPFKLSSPRKGFVCKRHGFAESRGGALNSRNEELRQMTIAAIPASHAL